MWSIKEQKSYLVVTERILLPSTRMRSTEMSPFLLPKNKHLHDPLCGGPFVEYKYWWKRVAVETKKKIIIKGYELNNLKLQEHCVSKSSGTKNKSLIVAITILLVKLNFWYKVWMAKLFCSLRSLVMCGYWLALDA